MPPPVLQHRIEYWPQQPTKPKADAEEEEEGADDAGARAKRVRPVYKRNRLAPNNSPKALRTRTIQLSPDDAALEGCGTYLRGLEKK